MEYSFWGGEGSCAFGQLPVSSASLHLIPLVYQKASVALNTYCVIDYFHNLLTGFRGQFLSSFCFIESRSFAAAFEQGRKEK
jgi:hypothetical protein